MIYSNDILTPMLMKFQFEKPEYAKKYTMITTQYVDAQQKYAVLVGVLNKQGNVSNIPGLSQPQVNYAPAASTAIPAYPSMGMGGPPIIAPA